MENNLKRIYGDEYNNFNPDLIKANEFYRDFVSPIIKPLTQKVKGYEFILRWSEILEHLFTLRCLLNKLIPPYRYVCKCVDLRHIQLSTRNTL